MIATTIQYILCGSIILCGLYYGLTHPDRGDEWVWTWGLRPLVLGNLSLLWFLPLGAGSFHALGTLTVGAWVLGAVIWLVLRYLSNKAAPDTDKHRRGAVLADTKKLSRLTKKAGGGVTIGGVPLPFEIENYHIVFAGGTGSGKSVGIVEMLDAVTTREDRIICADSGGLYLQRYAQDGDYLINPHDQRCAPWSPLAEMSSPAAADSLAKSYIPDQEGSGKQWSGYAQVVLAEILRKCWSGNSTNADLYRLCCCSTREELATLLAGTAAAPLVDPANGTMGANILSMVSSAMASVRYLPPDAGRDGLSIRKWVSDGKGSLYITYTDEQLDSLRGLIGTLLDLSAKSIVSLPPDPERRIWLVADELASLGKVSSLETFLTKARKCGGCAIVGLQSVSQLRERYGRDGAQTIMSCLSNWLILRAADSESAEYMSRLVGQAEILRTTKSGGKNPSGESENWSEHVTTQHVVMPSELQNLPNLRGYLILAGDYPTAKINLALPRERDSGFQSFVRREDEPAPQQSVAAAPAAPPEMPTPDAPTEKSATPVFNPNF